MRYLLDTTVVSSPISKTPNPKIIAWLDRHGHECGIAAPVWHELTYGCQRLPQGKRRTAIETYMHDVVQSSFPILPYDEDWAFASLARSLWKTPRTAFMDVDLEPALVSGFRIRVTEDDDFRMPITLSEIRAYRAPEVR